MRVRIAVAFLLVVLQAGCTHYGVGVPVLFVRPSIPSGKDAPGFKHVVKQGETLAALAEAYHVDLKHLAHENKLLEPYELAVGSTVFVPGASAVKHVVQEEKASLEDGHAASIGTSLSWPVEGKVAAQFGLRNGTQYNGIGISAAQGTPVHAAADGKVGHVGSILGLGNLVLMEHPDRLVTVYAHLKDIKVKEGQSVKRGTVIGTVGTSGRVDEPCLYFEVRSRSTPRNPLSFLERKG